MRARLRRFYLNGRKRAIFFFAAQVKNYLKRGMLDKGGRRDYFHRRL